MEFDYSRLLGRIKECGFTQETLSKQAKMSESTMCQKLNNRAPFKQKDICLICEALAIGKDLIGSYFFTPKVRKN